MSEDTGTGGFWGWMRELTRDVLNWKVLTVIFLFIGLYIGLIRFEVLSEVLGKWAEAFHIGGPR